MISFSKNSRASRMVQLALQHAGQFAQQEDGIGNFPPVHDAYLQELSAPINKTVQDSARTNDNEELLMVNAYKGFDSSNTQNATGTSSISNKDIQDNIMEENDSGGSCHEEWLEDSGSEYVPSDAESSEVALTERSQEPLDKSSADTEDGRKSKKRKSKGQVDARLWKRAKNANLRLHGQAYIGFKKNKAGIYKQTASKRERIMQEKCVGHLKKPGKGGPRQEFQCAGITEVQRKHLFTHFWNLTTWEAKKSFVTGQVLPVTPIHRRKTTATVRKNFTLKYHLIVNDVEENVIKETKTKKLVCKKMFLATLGIGEKTVQNWVLGTKCDNMTDKPAEGLPKSEDACAKRVADFLSSLPKLESHYCRASSRKLYLEPVWDSYRHVYRMYQQKCQEENKACASWTTFIKVFRKMNLEIWTPKKDQCNTCSAHKNGSVTDDIYNLHLQDKETAREEKEKDKSESQIDDKFLAYCVDLQAVLLAPRLNVTANYYKTKLKVHNLTYYNLNNKDVTCFVWHEGEGGLESDVFASIATIFLNREISKHQPKKIVIWSDGCCYQNRNTKLSNALIEIVKNRSVTIEQKYLVVGHTQMEVDSVHSSVERKLGRRKEIYLPSDYLRIITEARQNPSPYETIALSYSDFFQFELNYYSSIRPGKKTGDPVVTDICGLQYTTDGIMYYKLKFSDAWTELPHRQRRTTPMNNNARIPLYHGPCPIEESKFAHLQDLKELIPRDCRSFYENLLHK